jgi:hypothetical protein
MNLRLPTLVIALASASLVACGGSSTDVPPPTPALSAVLVDPASATLHPGDTRTFTAAPRTSTGVAFSGASVTWTTSDARVATVSQPSWNYRDIFPQLTSGGQKLGVYPLKVLPLSDAAPVTASIDAGGVAYIRLRVPARWTRLGGLDGDRRPRGVADAVHVGAEQVGRGNCRDIRSGSSCSVAPDLDSAQQNDRSDVSGGTQGVPHIVLRSLSFTSATALLATCRPASAISFVMSITLNPAGTANSASSMGS